MKNWTELVELMDTKVSIKVTEDDPYGYGFETEFSVAGEKFHFAAYRQRGSEEQEFEVAFSRFVIKPNGRLSAKFDVLADMDVKATLAVFSGVKASLEGWLKRMEEEPEAQDGFTFYFSAKTKDASRSKLYDKFAKIIARKSGAKLTRKVHKNKIFYYFQN